MSNKLIVTPSPHVKSAISTTSIMRDVLIALLPAAVMSVVIFGISSLILMVSCVAACIIFEYIYRKLMKKDCTVGDLSAAVTGLLLAMNLPSTFPVWMAIIGCAFAIIVIKQLFGGIGQNFANPAIAARVFLLASFATQMTAFTMDGVATATPLGIIKGTSTGTLPGLADMAMGFIPGSLGETCSIALVIGGIYLIAKKIITPTIPVAFIASAAVFSLLFGRDPLYDILGGGLLLGAIFMATDYTTSPATEMGKLIYGIGCGFLTMIIRRFGSYAEGVSFAILLMNIITPLIEMKCKTKPFGGAQK